MNQLAQDFTKLNVQSQDFEWSLLRSRMVNGKRILILGNYEMTVEEFIEWRMSLLTDEQRVEIRSGSVKMTPADIIG